MLVRIERRVKKFNIELIEKIINNLVLRFGEVKMFLSLSLEFEDEAINNLIWHLVRLSLKE